MKNEEERRKNITRCATATFDKSGEYSQSIE